MMLSTRRLPRRPGQQDLLVQRCRGAAPRLGTATRLIAALLALSPLLSSPPARAGLFDDDEARRQIVEIKREMQNNQRMLDERFGRIEAAVQDRRALVDLANLIDGLKQDMGKLRGQIEVLVNQSENLERRQKDLYVDLDNRLRKLEQSQAQIAHAQTQIQEKMSQGERDGTAEKQSYEAALNQFKVGNYQSAIAGFQGFMANFSNSPLVPSAQYWIGNAYYALRDYKTAIAAQQKVISSWPDNAKASDALLNIASSQAELGDQKAARETLRILVTQYPGSQAAEQAKQRLARRP